MLRRDVAVFFSRLFTVREEAEAVTLRLSISYRASGSRGPVSGHGWTSDFMDTRVVRAIRRCKRASLNYSEMKGRWRAIIVTRFLPFFFFPPRCCSERALSRNLIIPPWDCRRRRAIYDFFESQLLLSSKHLGPSENGTSFMAVWRDIYGWSNDYYYYFFFFCCCHRKYLRRKNERIKSPRDRWKFYLVVEIYIKNFSRESFVCFNSQKWKILLIFIIDHAGFCDNNRRLRWRNERWLYIMCVNSNRAAERDNTPRLLVVQKETLENTDNGMAYREKIVKHECSHLLWYV